MWDQLHISPSRLTEADVPADAVSTIFLTVCVDESSKEISKLMHPCIKCMCIHNLYRAVKVQATVM